jgi:hypothetical protein
MQVSVRRSWGCVAETEHQVLDSRSGGCRQGLACVAQVVKSETCHPDPAASTDECLAHGIALHRLTVPTHKDAITASPAIHVVSQYGSRADEALP